MDSGGVIVVRNKGELLPLTYIQAILKENPSCWASTFSQDNTLVLDQDLFTEERKPLTAEEFDDMQKQDKDLTTVYWFGFGVRSDDAVEPWVSLVNEKNEPTQVIFTEGSFPAYAQAQSSFPDDKHAADKFLIPTLKKLWTTSGQKLDQLVTELNDELTKQSITNVIGERGAITIMTAGFPPDTFDKNTGGSNFSWGWTSNTFGYQEAPPAPPQQQQQQAAVAPTGGLVRRNRTPTVQPAAPSTPAPAVEPAKVEPAPKTDVEAAQQQNIENAEGEYPMVGPDDFEDSKHLKGKERKNWFNHNCQFCPSDYYKPDARAPSKWKDGKPPLKDLRDLGKAMPANKQTLVTTTVIPTPPAGPVPVEPPIPAESVKKVQEQKLFTLDQNSRVIPIDPKQIQAYEAKNVPYFDAYGVPDDFINHQQFNWFINVGKADIHTLANIAFTERNRRMQLEYEMEQATAPKVDTSGAGVVKETVPPVQQQQPTGGLIRRRR